MHSPGDQGRSKTTLVTAPKASAVVEGLWRSHRIPRAYSIAISSQARRATEEDLSILKPAIVVLLAECRCELVSRGLGHITPKLHMIEEHTFPLMQRLAVGLGLMAEQGAESIHAELTA